MNTVACINCNAPLNIVPEMNRFACGHCGFPLEVLRSGSEVSLTRYTVRPPVANKQSTIAASAAPSLSEEHRALESLQEELATVQATKAKQVAESSSGWGLFWVFAVTVLFAFESGAAAVVVLFLGLWIWNDHAEGKKKLVSAKFDDQLASLSLSILRHPRCDAALGQKTRALLETLQQSGNQQPAQPQVPTAQTGSTAKLMVAAAGGAMAGAAIASAFENRDTQAAIADAVPDPPSMDSAAYVPFVDHGNPASQFGEEISCKAADFQQEEKTEPEVNADPPPFENSGWNA